MKDKSTIAQKAQSVPTAFDTVASLGVRRIEFCEVKEADNALDSYERLTGLCVVGNELGTFLQAFAR